MVKNEVEHLLSSGFIGTNKYAHWSQLLRRTTRNMCVEFRNLNLATLKDKYAMLVANMLVDSTANNGILTFMDDYSRYSQIFIAKEDVHKKPLSALVALVFLVGNNSFWTQECCGNISKSHEFDISLFKW